MRSWANDSACALPLARGMRDARGRAAPLEQPALDLGA